VKRGLAAAVAWLGLAAASCQPSPLADGMPANTGCTGCHGQNGDPTPPPAVNGSTSTQSIGVGAHLAHMRGSSLAGPVACVECHPFPSAANGTDHPDPLGRPAEVIFGALATKAPASPAWDRKPRTCAGSYCHGATLRGGAVRPPPVWTRVDGTYLACDACHGNPPGDTHPQMNECEVCHGEVVGAGRVITNPLLHVDGNVQIKL
jgi:predicted CxxxxCH...CXXCH cytochrome family protein